jgi:hypothetical protein
LLFISVSECPDLIDSAGAAIERVLKIAARLSLRCTP